MREFSEVQPENIYIFVARNWLKHPCGGWLGNFEIHGEVGWKFGAWAEAAVNR